MIIKEININKEYSFDEVLKALNEGKVVTSAKTHGNYMIKDNELKFQHQAISIWQECDYILYKEIKGKWYITEIGEGK